MTREEFWKFIHNPDIVRQDYIVAIRMRHFEHSEWEYTNELLTLNEDDPFYFIWDNDWWEGEKFVEILGYISIDDIRVPHNLQESKCPICQRGDLVYPATIGGYVCLRCSCIFDGKEKKYKQKTEIESGIRED